MPVSYSKEVAIAGLPWVVTNVLHRSDVAFAQDGKRGEEVRLAAECLLLLLGKYLEGKDGGAGVVLDFAFGADLAHFVDGEESASRHGDGDEGEREPEFIVEAEACSRLSRMMYQLQEARGD